MAVAPVSLVRPPALRPGDRVAVLTASSPVAQEALATGLAMLEFAGLEPVVAGSARAAGSVQPHLAGGDDLRAGDLSAALLDPGIAAILFARGGSGAQRTLERLDWPALAAARPKVLVGYSDVTAVLEAVAARLGWASLHGPTVAGTDPAGQYSTASLLRALMHPERATRLSFPDGLVLVPGRARGVTLGGNLTVLTASLGTPTSHPAAGGILLLEDVGEQPYRLDRMLTQLRRSGYLDGVAGVVTGTFTGCGERAAVEAVLADRLGDLGVPVLARADVGHGGRVQTFPLGVAADLDADAGTIVALEPPLVPAT